ncbi:pyridoxamine 5'-phosphate oxidase family protein [Pontixanthobacter sp.]|uniref:pyridoxamine 5'-phosphate oxidase family protein n=1 Tax=Pontixanthobacter sp. TaxID=2792078 RepID=UPI003C7BC7FD
MAEFFDTLCAKHIDMIAAQPVFFVATAAADARINLSPKGYDAFRVLTPDRVAYLDLGGSGNETNAHCLADGRITIMFCNFENPAMILRIYGRAVPVLPKDAEWDALAKHFTMMPGTRQIFDIAVDSGQTSCGWASCGWASCGWGVPVMSMEHERPTLKKAHAQSNPLEWAAKMSTRIASIDGLPARATDRYIAGDI